MPTRISGACNACRSKKQKCSGDKSGCAQCEAAGITCTWPEQRKRGPAKGYIEGLEHRLHDAESLLLQLLPHISTEQLQVASSALTQDGNESGRDSPDRRSSPPVLNKKTGIEYWENFPLTSAAAIRRWQQDCELHGGGSTLSARPELLARGSSPASHLMPSSEASRSKRRSLPGPPTSVSFPESTGTATDTSLDELFHMQDVRRMSGQIMTMSSHQRQQQEQMAMAMSQSQRGSPWQAPQQGQPQMMNIDLNTSRGDMTQTPMFTNVGYLNTPGQWTHQQHQQHHARQQNMPMDMHPHTTSADNVPIINSQTHSHLFW